jgi:hypothetical protein
VVVLITTIVVEKPLYMDFKVKLAVFSCYKSKYYTRYGTEACDSFLFYVN